MGDCLSLNGLNYLNYSHNARKKQGLKPYDYPTKSMRYF